MDLIPKLGKPEGPWQQKYMDDTVKQTYKAWILVFNLGNFSLFWVKLKKYFSEYTI